MTIDPKLIDVFPDQHDGYPDHLAAEDTTDALRDACGSASREFPESLWIEPREWEERAAENDRHGLWAMNFLSRYTNQHPTHECASHSLVRNFEAARNRARGVIFPDGPKKGFRYPESAEFGDVWMSPLSVYAELNPDKWGGSNVRQNLELACRRGILPDTTQPRDYGFKHTLIGTSGEGNENQSHGRWVPLSKFPEGWRETASHFRPLEVIFPESYEQAVCLLLHGMAVSVGRRGHAVPWARWIADKRLHEYPDSYDITRYDSEKTARSAWRGSFAIASVTLPDDWSRPAG
ncbi:MAG: hypothetical protein RLZZ21_1360 [Planctomycetota bacterium]|jgi:hypothetical protein